MKRRPEHSAGTDGGLPFVKPLQQGIQPSLWVLNFPRKQLLRDMPVSVKPYFFAVFLNQSKSCGFESVPQLTSDVS